TLRRPTSRRLRPVAVRQTPLLRTLTKALITIALWLLAWSCVGGNSFSPAASPPQAESPEELLTRVKQGVAQIRGLDFLEPVKADFLSPQELAIYLEEVLDEEVRQGLLQEQELLLVLGLISEDLDLNILYLDLLSETVVGLYDPEEEELLVRQMDASPSAGEELTLAHELTHALQQQHFDRIRAVLTDPAVLPATPALTAKMARESETVTAGRLLAQRFGCAACHTDNGNPSIGPTWKGLYGKQETLLDGSKVTVDESYLQKAIVEPNAQIVKGFPPSNMPGDYRGKLTDSEIRTLIGYMKALK
ncbi:MAG: c-type cytochrome, partial [SAR324 cluster bacterium]|nr:c-type cytochrome [SAR324 cluster bacterium]